MSHCIQLFRYVYYLNQDLQDALTSCNGTTGICNHISLSLTHIHTHTHARHMKAFFSLLQSVTRVVTSIVYYGFFMPSFTHLGRCVLFCSSYLLFIYFAILGIKLRLHTGWANPLSSVNILNTHSVHVLGEGFSRTVWGKMGKPGHEAALFKYYWSLPNDFFPEAIVLYGWLGEVGEGGCANVINDRNRNIAVCLPGYRASPSSALFFLKTKDSSETQLFGLSRNAPT